MFYASRSADLRQRFERSRRVLLILALWMWPWAGARAGGVLHNAFGVPRAEDGLGIKVGERSVFHTGFALGIGFDSNIYSNAKTESPVRGAYLWPSAWLGIGNRDTRDGMLMSPPERSARLVDYNVSLLAGFRQYLSRELDVRSVPKFSVGTQVRLMVLPGRRFSLALDEDFFRGASAGNYQALGSVLNFNRIDHRGQLTAYLRPGGGRLSFALGYRSQFLRFENGTVNTGNRVINGLYHESKWRFLPQSALVLTYTMDFTYYLDCCLEAGTGRNEDNFAHRLQAGYRGLLAPKVAFDALLGWGAGYYRADINGPNFNSVIGSVGVNYFPTLQTQLHLDLYRDFSDSLFGNYYVDNGARLAASHQFRWRMLTSLGFGVAGRRVFGLPVPGDESDKIRGYSGPGADGYQRKTVLFSLDAKLEQPLGKVFALSLGYNMVIDGRPFLVTYNQTGVGGAQVVDDVSYVRHLLMLIAAVRI